MTNEYRERELQPLPVETIILEAPSVDAAREQASKLWDVRAEDIVIEVLDEEKRLFGLLGKKMKLSVSTTAPIAYLQARDFADSIMRQSELDLSARLDDERTINLDGDDSAIVIGRHGDTLKALEFLTNLIYRTDQNTPKIRFDCGRYRVRREESLIRLAESVAREVVHKGSPVSLDPMSSWERRIIHLALQGNTDISTSSEGEEPFRKIVVHPGNNSERKRHPRKQRF
jgi:spoIIIJ-associated protein